MGFSYFRGIGFLSGINILVPYRIEFIDVVKSCGFSYKKIILILIEIDFSFTNESWFGKIETNFIF